MAELDKGEEVVAKKKKKKKKKKAASAALENGPEEGSPSSASVETSKTNQSGQDNPGRVVTGVL